LTSAKKCGRYPSSERQSERTGPALGAKTKEPDVDDKATGDQNDDEHQD
jgi:hypothetical protein